MALLPDAAAALVAARADPGVPGRGTVAVCDPSRALLMGALSRLRAGCRNVKEQLSSEAASMLTHRRAGVRSGMENTLRRNVISPKLRLLSGVI